MLLAVIDYFVGILKLADIKLTELEHLDCIFKTQGRESNRLSFMRDMLDHLLEKTDEKEQFINNL